MHLSLLSILSILSVPIVSVLPSLASSSSPSSPPVNAALHASWDTPPMIIRTLETSALYDEDLLFVVLDRLCTIPSGVGFLESSKYSSYQAYRQSLGAIGTFFSAAQHSAFKLSLAINEAAPRIEASYSSYNNNTSHSSVSCSSYIEYDGNFYCDLKNLQQILSESSSQHHHSQTSPSSSFSFDHIRKRTFAQGLPPVIFHASIPTKGFCRIHRYLTEKSEAGNIAYTVRWKPTSSSSSNNNNNNPLVLSGYGISLDVKKSEYLAIDDRPVDVAAADSHKKSSSGGTPVLSNADDQEIWNLDHAQQELPALTSADVDGLGLKATGFISRSKNPINALKRLTQSFPMHARSLVDVWEPEVNDSIAQEIRVNQGTKLPAGYNIFWLNGRQLPLDDIEPFRLMQIIRQEQKIIQSLQSTGMNTSEAVAVLSHPSFGRKQTPRGTSNSRRGLIPVEALGDIFDASDRQELSNVIVWWNDLTKDSRYKTWSTDINELLRRPPIGQLHSLKLNIFNIILMLDLTDPEHILFQAKIIDDFIISGYPFRFGIVPIIPEGSEVHITFAKCLWASFETAGRSRTLAFLKEVASKSMDKITMKKLATEYQRFKNVVENVPSFEAIVDDEQGQYTHKLNSTRLYLRRMGVFSDPITKTPLQGFINGAYFTSYDGFNHGLQGAFSTQTQFLQQQIYMRAVSEDTDIEAFFYDLPSSRSRRNDIIYPPAGVTDVKYVDLANTFKRYKLDEGLIYPNDVQDESSPYQSMWILGDLETDPVLNLVQEALKFLNGTKLSAKIRFVPNLPLERSSDGNSSVPLSNNNRKLLKLLKSGETSLDAFMNAAVDDYDDEAMIQDPPQFSRNDIQFGRHFATKSGIPLGSTCIIINGRIVGPFLPNRIVSDDLEALVKYELDMRVEPVSTALQEIVPTLFESKKDEVLTKAISAIGLGHVGEKSFDYEHGKPVLRNRDYRLLRGEYTSFEIGNPDKSWLHVAVSIDPLNEIIQKWSSIIETLSKLDGVYVIVNLNPSHLAHELPIKRFYRFVYPHELEFDMKGNELAPSINFDGMPLEVLLTLTTHTPHSWLVFPQVTPYDLDNIRLTDIPQDGVNAVFELKNIILEGHALEVPRSEPPRGLQLVLSNDQHSSEYDSLVMANLGYFQLKSTPGTWNLSIRDGKSSQVFKFKDGKKDISVDIVDFVMPGPLFAKFERQPGKELVELYDDNLSTSTPASSSLLTAHGASLWAQKVFTKAKGVLHMEESPSSTQLTKGKADINIFTVASGRLYERMAFIMMLSVTRHTNSTCKFWIIENFVSPAFKKFIPHLAETYNFDYEFVTYKWPPWLRGQKEKQRTIWGYKILFLDVLFPLELDRVIFVDSDQIVRTDLKELVDMDLQGAPYAYAPMGDDREETEGFRFWKTGYWKEHLAGKPYHISALYVVDLDRFRATSAGDRLRGQYQGLSSDPNSLANLDQDLPNNMQHSIPIHTLDNSWLWCETWCSDDSLADAKTIDLCNNPLTHEPKLTRAKRLIPEWSEYDTEIAELARKFEGKTEESMAFGEEALANERNDIDNKEGEAIHTNTEPVRDEL